MMDDKLAALSESAFAYAQSESESDATQAEQHARELCASETEFSLWIDLTLMIDRLYIEDLQDATDWLNHQLS